MEGFELSQKPVTIVIPAYGDVASLVECIRSVKECVDLSRNLLLIVNDSGPEADAVEHAVQAIILDTPTIRYERNSVNLGFVGNCNRAVLELDKTENDVLLLNSDTVVTPGFLEEMLSVLYLEPNHGVVCARSNNATIASLPFRQVIARTRSAERTQQVFDDLSPELARFNVSPVAMGFCFLIRRDLISRFGLFDEVFSPGYGEENDFCLRVNGEGFLSVIANRALVFHGVAASFTNKRREALRREHGLILSSRYPYYDDAVRSYLLHDVDPVDHFSDAITPRSGPHRIVVDAGTSDPVSSDAASVLIDALKALPRQDVEVFLVAAPRYYAKCALRYRGVTVVPADKIDGIFDLAILVDANPGVEDFVRMARLSCRWVVLEHDPQRRTSWCRRMGEPHGGHVLNTFMRLSNATISASTQREEGLELVLVGSSGRYPDSTPLVADSAIVGLVSLAKARPDSFDSLRMRSAIAGWTQATGGISGQVVSSGHLRGHSRVLGLLTRMRRRLRSLIRMH